MDREKLNFKLDTYTDHLREMLHALMTSKELSDITLVSEDKKQFKAHKVVLCASSSLFKQFVSNNCCTNPFIFLRGIQSHVIESILQFIYLGETSIPYEQANEFLEVAKSLEIKEIENPHNKPLNEVDNHSLEKIKVIENPQNSQPNNAENLSFEPTLEVPISNTEPEHTEEDNCIKNSQINSNPNNKIQHNKYCVQCDKQFTHKTHFNRHIKSIHEGVKYPCSYCKYKATQKTHLKQHIISSHGEAKAVKSDLEFMIGKYF